MVATVEFQINATKFAKAILSTLRTSPRCPPGAVQGLQLQRVRFRSAATRNDQTSSFRVWQEMGQWDQGLGWTWIKGKIAQLAIDVTLEITGTAQIIANPNVLPPTIAQPEVTIVLDLDCEPNGGGRIAISYEISGVKAPALSIGGASLPEWARDQLTELLDLEPVVIDLSDAIAHGKDFMNAGLAIDTSGTRLVIRAEVSGAGFVASRWWQFRNGGIPDRLGPHDWSVFMRAADLNAALVLPIDRAIQDGLKNEAHRLVTIGFAYAPQPGRAVITLTPYFELPVIGVTPIPVALTLSIDSASGRLIVELDAYGIRDIVADVKQIAYIAINLLMPIVGWFVSAALNDAIGDAMKVASSAASGEVQNGLGEFAGTPAGTTFEEIPGLPFRYRATIPVAVPAFVDGAFEELVATPDGVALAGRWHVLNFTEGEMTVDTSEFGWQAPEIACGADGERVLHDFAANAKKYAHLYAQVSIAYGGSARARLCSVAVLDAPGVASGLNIAWMASDLPNLITITAPSSYTDIAPAAPILLEVRTTAGVFHVSIPRPPPLTEEEIARMRSILVARLQWCDAHILPPWFDGVGKFDLSWIVDPLVDPDYGHSWVSLTEIAVTGLAAGARLQLVGQDDRTIAEARVNTEGTALLSAAMVPGMRGLFASVGGLAVDRPRDAEIRARSVTVTRELLEARGIVRLPAPARALFAVSVLGAGRFLAALDDRLMLVDTRVPTRPLLGATWNIPGALGVVGTPRGMLIFGEAGMFAVDRGGHISLVDREPVLYVAELRGGVAILKRGRLVFTDHYGASIAEERVDEEMTALVVHGAQLRILSRDRIETIETVGPRPTRRFESACGLDTISLMRSSIDGRLYGERRPGQYLAIVMEGGEPTTVTSYAVLPWQARAVRSGQFVLRLAGGVALNVYRSTGPREIVPVEAARLCMIREGVTAAPGK